MDIGESFNEHVIEDAEVTLSEEETQELRGMIRSIYEANQFDVPNEPEMNVAVLCFIAGRAYQTEVGITVEMTLQELREYSKYLLERSQA